MIDSLPKLPAVAEVRSTNIWIVEWLSPGERRTGSELYDWMEQQRPKWAIYNQCDCKADVIRSIEQAAQVTQQIGIMPILHIEAHGGPDGMGYGVRSCNQVAWVMGSGLAIKHLQANLIT